MRPWNPYAQTFHGEPITGQIPVRVVVRGPKMTPQQSAFLQAAYASFAAGARLSIAPNPSAQGYLPDGSQYTIDCVNGACTCVVWPVGEVDDIPRGGIGITLTTLAGGLIPEHTRLDGLEPQPYILTPEVHAGTRKSTGVWRARKVEGYVGGKAVWTDKSGRKAFVGVAGTPHDSHLLEHLSADKVGSVNVRAYWSGQHSVGSPYYMRGGKTVGVARTQMETIPFLRKHTNGETWIMQIAAELFPVQKLSLYGGRYVGAETYAPIGELLHELQIPAGHSIVWQTLSVSPDGNGVRLSLKHDNLLRVANADLAVSDVALSITSIITAGDSDTGTVVEGWSPHSPGWTSRTLTRTDKAGGVRIPGGYGYAPRGEKTEYELMGLHPYGEQQDGETRQVETRSFSSSDLSWNFKETTATTSFFRLAGTAIRYDTREVTFPRGFTRREGSSFHSDVGHRNPTGETTSHHVVNTTQEDREREETSIALLLLAAHLDFYVASYHGVRVDVSSTSKYTYSYPGAGHVWGPDTEERHEVHFRRIVATYKGAEILRSETSVPEGSVGVSWIQFAAAAAIDPLTGAVCVNVLEIDTRNWAAPPLRSWIILADDKSAKFLHEVMELPAGTDVRIKKDDALLSVV